MIKGATMKEAKARWASHTKQVLSPTGRARAKERATWSREAGVPVVTIGHGQRDRFAFYTSEHGHTFGQMLD